jgi:hypothetical protein
MITTGSAVTCEIHDHWVTLSHRSCRDTEFNTKKQIFEFFGYDTISVESQCFQTARLMTIKECSYDIKRRFYEVIDEIETAKEDHYEYSELTLYLAQESSLPDYLCDFFQFVYESFDHYGLDIHDGNFLYDPKTDRIIPHDLI